MANKKGRDDERRLASIVELCDSIDKALYGVSIEQFEENDVLQDAIAYRLASIGEECRNLSDEVTSQHDLPWKQIIGMRNRLAHDYFGSSPKVIFDTATNDIAPLRAACVLSVKLERE